MLSYKTGYKRKSGPEEKPCLFCGKLYNAKVSHQRFCTKDCRTGFYKKDKWVPKTRKCDVCGGRFKQKTSNQKRCSKNCGDEWLKHVYVKNTKTPKKINCQSCKKEIGNPGPNQKYCCKRCRKTYYKTKQPPPSMVEIARNRWLIFERDNFKCIYCGKSSIEDASELHIDHVMPKSKGGDNTIHNLVTSCSECNVAKGAAILNKKKIGRLLTEINKRNTDNNINPNIVIKY